MREVLFGRNAVRECLRAGRRRPYRLAIAEGVRRAEVLGEIVQLAERAGVPVERAPRAALDQGIPAGRAQGVALEVEQYPYSSLSAIMQRAAGRPPLLLLLDRLQDPQNVGALLRAAEAVGVHGVVMQARRSAEITPAVVKASAGAVEHLLIARETNLAQAMEWLKGEGLWLAGLHVGPEAHPIGSAALHGPLGLVVGSEGEGLRRLVREKCDWLIGLPQRGQVESLNAATAGAVALYLVWQARGFEGARPPAQAEIGH